MLLNLTDALAWLVTMNPYILTEGATLTHKALLQQPNSLNVLLLHWSQFLSAKQSCIFRGFKNNSMTTRAPSRYLARLELNNKQVIIYTNVSSFKLYPFSGDNLAFVGYDHRVKIHKLIVHGFLQLVHCLNFYRDFGTCKFISRKCGISNS